MSMPQLQIGDAVLVKRPGHQLRSSQVVVAVADAGVYVGYRTIPDGSLGFGHRNPEVIFIRYTELEADARPV